LNARPVYAIRKEHHTSRMRMRQLTLLIEKLNWLDPYFRNRPWRVPRTWTSKVYAIPQLPPANVF